MGMGGLGLPSAPTRTAAQVVKVDLSWIRFEGHSLVYRDEQLEEVLRENLRKNELFADEAENVIFEKFDLNKGDNNITYFKLRAKLKNPITVMR